MSLLTKLSNKIQYSVSKNLDDPEAAEYASQQKVQELQDAESQKREQQEQEDAAAAEAKKAEDEKEAVELARRSEFKASRAIGNSANEILKIFGSLVLVIILCYAGHIAANEAIGYRIPFRLLSFLYGAIFFFYVIPKSFYDTLYLKKVKHFYTFLPLSTYVPTGNIESFFLTPFCYVEDSFSAEARKEVEALYANGLTQSMKAVANASGVVAATVALANSLNKNSPESPKAPNNNPKAPESPKAPNNNPKAPNNPKVPEPPKVEPPKVEPPKP